ncbi:MAG: hypothetical protein EXX96DRAFT_494634, partial [Benjaminiella poitrasii]
MHTDSYHLVPNEVHSLGSQPRFDWVPSDRLSSALDLTQPLFDVNQLLVDDKHRLLDLYPLLHDVDYRPPATLPEAHSNVNKGQKLEDSALQDIKYLLSGIFRPLDVLDNELLHYSLTDDAAVERNMLMLSHIRALLVNVCATLTMSRNQIAMRAVNRQFKVPNPTSRRTFTMPSNYFQTAITQQTSTSKALKEAQQLNRRPRPSPQQLLNRRDASPSQTAFSTGGNPQFFRSGPSSQHGGYPNNKNGNAQSNIQRASNSNSKKPFHQLQRGRLQHFHHQWTHLFHNQWITQSLQFGFKIPFHTLPPLSTNFTRHTYLSSNQSNLLDQSVTDLLSKYATEQVTSPSSASFISPMFVIPKKTGGFRPVFNLRSFNQHIDCPHFKMETLQQVTSIIQESDYLTSIDLSD